MSRDEVRSGTCRTCGRALVQTPERTYHPWNTGQKDDPCPDLIPIPGTYGAHLSHDVSSRNFIPKAAE